MGAQCVLCKVGGLKIRQVWRGSQYLPLRNSNNSTVSGVRMALKGQAKVKYQRKYMKKRRALKRASAETGVNLLDPSVRPDMLQNRYGELITYPIDADGSQIYD